MKKKALGKVFLCIVVFLAVLVFQGEVPANAATVVYSYDFESCSPNWAADNGVWECGAPISGPAGAHSGSNVMATVLSGDYPDFTDSRLISPSTILPSIDISANEELRLRFWQWFELWSSRYNSCSGATCWVYIYDYGKVQISAETSPGTWSAWTDISTITGNSGAWTNTNIDISSYAGQKV
ncbi:MAG: hypothetical protein WA610_12290, partial [Thermodesulfovibrionales bacterium]